MLLYRARNRISVSLAALAGLCSAGALAVPSAASAASITVTTVADELTVNGNCSLREAIQAANTNTVVDGCTAGQPGLDSINMPSGGYAMTIAGANEDANQSGDFDVTDDLLIQSTGNGATIEAGSLDRVFHLIPKVDGGETQPLSFETNGITLSAGRRNGGLGGAIYAPGIETEVTLSNGRISSSSAASGGAIYAEGPVVLSTFTLSGNSATTNGGAIFMAGSGLTLTDVAVTNNTATSAGGGLYLASSFNATIIQRTTLAGNQAGTGGGGAIFSKDSTNLQINSSTISTNSTTGRGGGVAVGDGVSSVLTYISFSTIADNTAATGGGIGILKAPSLQASVEMINNIVADNTATTGPDVSGTFTSRGYNLVSSRTGSTGFTATGDQTGTTASPLDPLLDTLRNNGGVTNTYALAKGSPAIDTGTCSGFGGLVIASDQRGVSRPFGTRCDIGAFEFKTFPIVVRVVPVGTGSLCTTGGLRIDSGEDINGDNVLQDSEVRTQANVCNGLNGFNALVAVSTLDVGSPECAAGGQKIQSGLDNGDGAGTSRDNTLQTGEVDSTAIICNGVKGDTGDAGFNGLVKMTTIGTGDATCPTGGQKIDSGLDNGDGDGTARNGTLEPGEIDGSSILCNGFKGDQGFNTLIRTATLAINDPTCPTGGQRILSGLDNGDGGGTANDGVLQDGEVDGAAALCTGARGPNGTNGTNGANSLVKVTSLLTNDVNCPTGGQKLESGLDNGRLGGTTANGTLEPGEITSTAYVCNGGRGEAGSNGFNSLVRTQTIPAGSVCANGGITYFTGLDNGDNGGTARNGTLESGESDTITSICNGDTGFSQAFRFTEIEVNDPDCPFGGQTVEQGLDNGSGTGSTARDGVLQDGEVLTTFNLCNGRNGVDGGAALTTLVRTTTIQTGDATCPFGGVLLQSGLDNGTGGGIAGNRVLEAGEVQGSATICNGADGFNSLLKTTPVAPGTTCPNGGTLYESGLDDGEAGGTARNGTLEPGEIDASVNVCNGTSGSTALSRVTAIARGDEACPTGGQKVESGLDNGDVGGTAGNGTLENGEVDSSANVCNGAEALVTVTPIDTGDAQCPAGGQTLKVGIDINGDNAFGEGELPAETKICNGEKGPRGFSPVVKVTALAVGDKACPGGGTVLAIGLDDGEGEGAIGENGILEDAEIDSTASICNGGAQKVLVTRINAGAACPDGGVNITVGTDKDGNGKIEGAEIESNQNICESVGGGGGGCSAGGAEAGNNATGVALTLFGLLGFAGAVAGRRRRLAVVRSDSRP
jgi:CSLREA domain-containing protein